MKEVTPISNRKTEHLRINLEENVQSGLTSGLECYHFVHHALPEINLTDVDVSVKCFSKRLEAPILISSMTGGTSESADLNRILAIAAQEAHIAMGVGSQRIVLEQPELANTFDVRDHAPDILLFANLGAIQLNYGYGIEACQRSVEMIHADALVLHFNALQEAIQREGDTHFAGIINKVEAICKELPVPVIAKEVGWGFSRHDITLLANAGVAAIDVAGAGGTSWSQVEMHRAENEEQRKLAAAFDDWGIPTVEVIENILQVAPGLTIIASGGLRNGIDIAKCIALGASLGGMASPFLKAAAQSVEETLKLINLLKQEIRVCMFVTGSKTLEELRDGKLRKQ
ncbi:MAG TPA: type 2 isopentenyl-diphosphate Delta-isomerase [Anaerolineales bacterium]|nr:type 2 isopentenyl-diphosphate Delta-isomerase [Anaerolineales bacterium]